VTITAKYPGVCASCGGRVTPGQQIEWAKGQPTRHTACVESAPFSVYGGSGYGCRGWTAGDILCSKDVKPWQSEKQAFPEFLYVVRASRKYYREDGMSFGVGAESGYTYAAECREATDEEAAPLRAKMEERRREQDRLVEIGRVFKMVQDIGERPQGMHVPEGEEVQVPNSGERLYGSGSWFVVGSEWIWAIQNNGMDGDDWSRNNVRTGGAGAIGHRVARTEELAAKILGWKTPEGRS